MTLEPDRDQIEIFVDAIFRRAADQGFVAVRSFFEDDDLKPARLSSADLRGGLRFLIDVAEDDARRAAQHPRPIVFCPPLAVFSNGNRAREADIAQGLALSVEIDEHPLKARKTLESILGAATVVIKSGGRWANGGEAEDKLHLHWRLDRPACGAELGKLKQARDLATRLVGGDPSNKPVCHPIRWPGSWHRKAEPPSLCQIDALDPDREIELAEALTALIAASPEAVKAPSGDGVGRADGDEWPELVADIVTGRKFHKPLVSLSARLIGSNMHDGTAVKLLRALMLATAAERDGSRWQARYDAIPGIVKTAREKFTPADNEPPQSLVNQADPPLPFPIDALGDVLGPAARAIAAKVQCAEAMAAQSVLAVASLAAQGLADVLLPYGQTRPLSLFALTVAASGDRKSSADKEAMIPVRVHERNLAEQYKVAKEIYAVDVAAWRATHHQIERGKMEKAERAHQLTALGPEPTPPIKPLLTIGEGTAEGLAKLMPELPGAVGIFSAEGGQFLNGYGFSADAKLRTAATFASLWDGDGIRRARAEAGLINLPGRRLACHLMVQPNAAQGILSDPALRDQGYLSRFIIVAPNSLAGSRLWRQPSESLEPELRRYTARLLSVFEAPQQVGAAANELMPRALTLSTGAREAWAVFQDETERAMGEGGRCAELHDVAGKAAEQAGRIAGVLAIIDDWNAEAINLDAMKRACGLGRFYLSEALRLARAYLIPQEVADAQAILDWAKAQKLVNLSARLLQRSGPGPLRRRERLNPAIDVLLTSGWLVPDPKASGKARQWIVKWP